MNIAILDLKGNEVPVTEFGLIVKRKPSDNGLIESDYWVPPNSTLIKVVNHFPCVETFNFSIYGSNKLEYEYTESDGKSYLGCNYTNKLHVRPGQYVRFRNNTDSWIKLYSQVQIGG